MYQMHGEANIYVALEGAGPVLLWILDQVNRFRTSFRTVSANGIAWCAKPLDPRLDEYTW